jgi:hypothetical protein
MPTYAGNLINNPGQGNLPGNNYKTSPSTRFGTRQIQRINIYTTVDTTENYLESNSIYSQLVRALQQTVEVYAVHMPNPSFFSCWGEFCFQADIAYDTASDTWNNVNSFIDDGDPVNWYWGYPDYAPFDTKDVEPIHNALYQALTDAGVVTYVFPMITWTVGDMTWPSNNSTVSEGLQPLNTTIRAQVDARKPAELDTADLAVTPGENAASRFAKLAKWMKTLNK